jgi:dipeptidyl aminopeptidase/acylaminoacyl peptidase
MRLGTLMAAPFDLTRAEITGGIVAAMGDVMQSGMRARAGANNTGAGMYAVSSLGALAVIRGPVTGGEGGPLIWRTRNGQSVSAEPTSGAPAGSRIYTRISPDQARAATTVITSTRRELWLVDWARNLWSRCEDCSATTVSKAWSPDSRRLLLGRNDTLIAHALDGAEPDRELVRELDHPVEPAEWLADGRIIYLKYVLESQSYEIKLLEPGGKVGRVIVPLGVGTDPAVSPNGRWLAYDSTTPGKPTTVVVQAFPGPGPRIQVSAGGGSNPAWSADSRTVYYLANKAGGGVVAVDIGASGSLTAGTPRELFQGGGTGGCKPIRCYDIGVGPRFLFNGPSEAGHRSVARMDLVLNWVATLGRK